MVRNGPEITSRNRPNSGASCGNDPHQHFEVVSQPDSWRGMDFSRHPGIMIGQIEIPGLDRAMDREPDICQLARSAQGGPAGCLWLEPAARDRSASHSTLAQAAFNHKFRIREPASSGGVALRARPQPPDPSSPAPRGGWDQAASAGAAPRRAKCRSDRLAAAYPGW